MLLKTFLSIIVFLGCLLLVEFLKRKTDLPTEYTRKFFHFFGCILAIGICFAIGQKLFLLLTVLCSVFLFLSYRSKALIAIDSIERKSWGSFLLPLGLGLLSFTVDKGQHFFVAGVMQLAIADTSAGLFQYVTDRSKKHPARIFLFFLTSYLIYQTVFPFYQAVLLSVVQTIVELFSPRGIDNLLLPVCFTVMTLILN